MSFKKAVIGYASIVIVSSALSGLYLGVNFQAKRISNPRNTFTRLSPAQIYFLLSNQRIIEFAVP